MDSRLILKKHNKYLFPAVKNYYSEPLVITEGKGSKVWDVNGKSYLDFFGGILTISVGHSNEFVNHAVKKQLDQLTHISTLYPTLSIVALAEKLANLTPDGLEKSFFTTSGTEADETAVMIAQLFTGNSEIIALRYGYSGRSLLAQSLTAHSTWRALSTQVPSVKHALSPYCYRCPLKQTYPECGVACAHDVEELIQTTTTGQIAGILIEPIQGVGGFITPPKEYFQIVAEIVRKHGGVFISDEVQTGFGRTGKMWGIEQFGVTPDIMTMAKGIANGFPIGAVVTTTGIAESLKKNSISTFGGNPISCTAALATIDVILDNNLTENSEKMGNILRKGLESLKEKYPKTIGDVRGMGLMQALELVVDETRNDRTPNTQAAEQLMEETRERGLLLGKGGLHGNVLRISPSLNIRRNEVEAAIQIINDSFASMNQ